MPPIDRTNWRYWIDGAGSWVERWHCTSDDLFLFVFMTFGVLWMVGEYFYYAQLLKQARGLFYDDTFRVHLKKLMNVFIFCGSIHLMNVATYFWTPYLLWAALFYVNALLSHQLNRAFASAIISKRLTESISEARLRDIGDRLEHIYLGDLEPTPKTLRELAEELRRMC